MCVATSDNPNILLAQFATDFFAGVATSDTAVDPEAGGEASIFATVFSALCLLIAADDEVAVEEEVVEPVIPELVVYV